LGVLHSLTKPSWLIRYGGIFVSIACQTGIRSLFTCSSREPAMRLVSSSLAAATSMVALNVPWLPVLAGAFSGEVVGLKMNFPSGPSYR